MTSIVIASRAVLFLLLISTSTSLVGCQTEPEQDSEIIRHQWADSSGNPMVTHGQVIIKLEPHGSIRATVFQGQTAAYEFILDREKQQHVLTNSIDNADVYLTGKYRDGLVIDDQQSQKRYVLSFYDIAKRLKNIPTTQLETVFIEGYVVELTPSSQLVALNSY